jgi:hypothetical protein
LVNVKFNNMVELHLDDPDAAETEVHNVKARSLKRGGKAFLVAWLLAGAGFCGVCG